jgi:hypothetical protein
MEATRRLKAGEEGTLDLQQYVLFKRNYRMLVRAFEHAAGANQSVWRLLAATNEGFHLHFNQVSRALHRARTANEQAAKRYRLVMERYPNNATVLRSYAHFQVRDPFVSGVRE